MGQRVIITGGNIDGVDSVGRDANVDANGNLWVRSGHYAFDNKTYEGTVTAGNTPVTCAFYNDAGRNAYAGWIINDGDADIQVDFSRDNVNYDGAKWTLKLGEITQLDRLDIAKLRITRVSADASYRVFLI